MNNRELENYFSLFSRKRFNCFCIKGHVNFWILSVSTETSRETTSTARRREKSYFHVSTNTKIYYKGKMEFSLILIILCMCGTSDVSIMPELKHNILRFGYRVNFRYEGMPSHSFDRFYVVTKIEIPKVSDLNLTMCQFDYNCSHVVNIEQGTRFIIPSTIKEMFNIYCKNIIPYMCLYKLSSRIL